jgi:hypothetical protein
MEWISLNRLSRQALVEQISGALTVASRGSNPTGGPDDLVSELVNLDLGRTTFQVPGGVCCIRKDMTDELRTKSVELISSHASQSALDEFLLIDR